MTENPLSKVFRIHIGGDFYDRTYLGYWMEIIRNQPKTRFYTYTRSWQDGTGNIARAFVKGLRELSGIGNMRLRRTRFPGRHEKRLVDDAAPDAKA